MMTQYVDVCYLAVRVHRVSSVLLQKEKVMAVSGSKSLRWLILAVAVASMLLTTRVHAQYAITDLGQVYPTAINAAGQVAGDIGQSIFLYDGTVHNLGTPAGFNAADAKGISSTGVICGQLIVGQTSFPAYAFYYDTSYHQVTNSQTSIAYGINSAGHMAGTFGAYGAWICTDGSTLQPVGGGVDTAFAINDNDQATGQGSTGLFYYSGGVEADIPTPNKLAATGYAISSNGYIAGDFSNGDGFLYANGGYQNLGTLEDLGARPNGVNDQGSVVGFSPNRSPPTLSAFIYQNGVITNLDSFINPSSGWTLTNATGINDSGEIVGVGMLDGVQHGFLLTPTPEPSSLAAVLCGLWFIRRKRR
jgi:probable HAF family extracellular repeat protein